MTGRGIIEASARDRDGDEWFAGFGVAEIKLQMGRMVPEGVLQDGEAIIGLAKVLQVRGREREEVVGVGSESRAAMPPRIAMRSSSERPRIDMMWSAGTRFHGNG